jgi:hypothetical protein
MVGAVGVGVRLLLAAVKSEAVGVMAPSSYEEDEEDETPEEDGGRPHCHELWSCKSAMDIACERLWEVNGFFGEELRGGVLRGEAGQRHEDCIIIGRPGGMEGWARTTKQKDNDDGIARLKLVKIDHFWCHDKRMWVICARPRVKITETTQTGCGAGRRERDSRDRERLQSKGRTAAIPGERIQL